MTHGGPGERAGVRACGSRRTLLGRRRDKLQEHCENTCVEVKGRRVQGAPGRAEESRSRTKHVELATASYCCYCRCCSSSYCRFAFADDGRIK